MTFKRHPKALISLVKENKKGTIKLSERIYACIQFIPCVQI
jgi:hypothetical protein